MIGRPLSQGSVQTYTIRRLVFHYALALYCHNFIKAADMKAILKIVSIIILLILSFGAFYGAYVLISEPSGAKFDWTVEMLEGTPFKDFMIPGIILLVANGLFPLYIIYTAIRNKSYFPLLLIIQGIVLIIWLSAEILFNPALYAPGLTPTFFIVGVLLLFAGFFEKKFFKIS